MNLVIVESPTKARKLSSFLGKDFAVESSVGHIVDLPKSKLGVDVENGFLPQYEISEDKKTVVSKLRNLAKKADVIYLASDPDREGEAIAWHVENVIKESLPKNSKKDFKRATFHEITKEAVQEAIDQPGQVQMDLVNAQQARRVLDRLVGYKVSPVLWKKIRRGLSAGRVQSVALRLIVEREKEIVAFVPEEYWEVAVALTKTGRSIKVDENWDWKDLPAEVFLAEVVKVNDKKYEPKEQADVAQVVIDLQQATYQVTELEKKNRQRASFPPFITSTLQQAAATRLGFTSKQTMTLAQQLYEEGLITYHRTDSFNLSAKAVEQARSFIKQEYGDKYVPSQSRVFAKKSKNAQEAHEAIRVTNINLPAIDASKYPRFTASHAKLYDLIWRRFMASQMAAAIYDQTAVRIGAQAPGSTVKYELKANGSMLKFDGWMKLFPNREDKILPALEPQENLDFVKERAEQKFTQPPPRYNDASIIKELESRGIGRPSTYASIISVIIDRGYVERQDKKFFATPVGITVTDFLMANLGEIMEYDFTAEMEEDLDEVAQGKKDWQKVVGDFYWPFEKKILAVDKDADRVAVPTEPTGEKCPDCHQEHGGMQVIRTGRYGKFLSCDRYPECKFTKPLINKIEGLHCPLCGEGDVISRQGRFGNFYGCSRYPDCDWTSYRPPKPDEHITAEEWAAVKAAKAERAAKRQATMAAKKEAATGKKPAAKTKAKATKKKTTAKKATKKTTATKATKKTTKKATTAKKS